VLPFKANSGQDLHMEFEMRKKRKIKKAEEFTKRMKEVYEEAKAVLRKSQEGIRKYADRKRSKPEEYRVGDWVLLSTKDLEFQMQGRHSEKLMDQFVGPCKGNWNRVDSRRILSHILLLGMLQLISRSVQVKLRGIKYYIVILIGHRVVLGSQASALAVALVGSPYTYCVKLILIMIHLRLT